MLARDVMTTAVVTVSPETGIREIARLLTERRISAVPVVDAKRRVVGIVSEGDLMRRAETGTEKERGSWWLTLFAEPDRLARDYTKTHGRRAEDIMTRDVVSVSEDTKLSDVARTLERNHVKRVPVLRDGEIVGIVSRANLLQGLAVTKTPARPTAAANDATIREAVLQKLRGEPWVQRAYANATVENGTVHLWGLADTEAQIRAIEVAAKEVAGVKKVENHMSVAAPHLYYGE